MTREWTPIERHEGKGFFISLYARALHAQLHRWVGGDGRVGAALEGDLFESAASMLARYSKTTRSDRRLIGRHLRELVDIGAIVLTTDGLELHSLADPQMVVVRDDPRYRIVTDQAEFDALRAVARRRHGAEVRERDGHRCVYCGAVEDLTLDHVVPLSRGGANDVSNLTTACRPCNSSKGSKVLS